jgi:toxin YoeB
MLKCKVAVGGRDTLTYDFQSYWSRRITIEHRLVYTVDDNAILVAFCKNHY